VPLNISYQDQSGRLQRFAARKLEQTPADVHRDITLTRRSMQAMGATYGVLYPTTCVRLATQPKRDWEFARTFGLPIREVVAGGEDVCPTPLLPACS
jgi:hypothetical protein